MAIGENATSQRILRGGYQMIDCKGAALTVYEDGNPTSVTVPGMFEIVDSVLPAVKPLLIGNYTITFHEETTNAIPAYVGDVESGENTEENFKYHILYLTTGHIEVRSNDLVFYYAD